MVGLYLHIPYCVAKCHYCDFNSRPPLDGESFEPYVEALTVDIRRQPAWNIDTVFFGGGTPSILSGRQIARLMAEVRRSFSLSETVEVTLEANPGTVDEEKCHALLEAGINRISFGVQSSHDRLLRTLGRQHLWDDALAAYRAARRAGFRRINLDVMYGLPGQTVADWQATLESCLALEPEHLSTYSLIVEEHTVFGTLAARGDLSLPDEDAEDAMADATRTMCEDAGLHAYEVSNWARPAEECRHNLVYWSNSPYLGLGAGAVSYTDGWRWTRIRRPQTYIDRVQQKADLVETGERVASHVRWQETVSLAARRFDGIDLGALERRFDIEPGSLEAGWRAEFEAEARAGLISFESGRMRLSWDGMRVANNFILRLMETWPWPVAAALEQGIADRWDSRAMAGAVN